MKKYIFIMVLLFQGCNTDDDYNLCSDRNLLSPTLRFVLLDDSGETLGSAHALKCFEFLK